jgi:hypothetical protein
MMLKPIAPAAALATKANLTDARIAIAPSIAAGRIDGAAPFAIAPILPIAQRLGKAECIESPAAGAEFAPQWHWRNR